MPAPAAVLLNATRSGAQPTKSHPSGGFVVWLTGPSEKAKTRLAYEISAAIAAQRRTEVLEGAELEDVRLGVIARLLARNGVAVVVAPLSLNAETRDQARQLAATDSIPFVEACTDAGIGASISGAPDPSAPASDGAVQHVIAFLAEQGLCTTSPLAAVHEAAAAPRSVVIVRDRDPAALRHPELRFLQGLGTVAYVHASDPSPLPRAAHYVFNLERLDAESRARASRAHENGARVTLILQHVDSAAAAFLAGTTWNVLPAYGDIDHIGVATFRRALRMAFDGAHVVARGFLENSGAVSDRADAGAADSFLGLLQRMSDEAKQGASVVAAVLAQRRTGSQWLRDLIGWTVASDVRVVHEHAIPSETDGGTAPASLLDALAREADAGRHKGMRRGALRSAVLTADRRYVFATYRDPVDRVVSYFVKRHSGFLRERLDAASQLFRDPAEIQRAFELWLPDQVRSHSRWFRTTLFDHFGVDVCRAASTEDGLLIDRHPPNTLVVVPIERLNSIRDAIEAAYGVDSCAPLVQDSAIARGDGAISAAFRRQIRVPPAIANALRGTREAVHMRAHARSAVSATTAAESAR